MSPKAVDGKAEARADLLEKVVAYGCARLAEPTSTSFARFAPRYYAHVASEDAGARSVADLYGAALAHLRLAERRVPGTPVVRICTPTFDEHGYESMHTVLQIVTDDMPFLVDSVSMELDRHGVGIHLVIHPIIPVRRTADGALLEVLGDRESDDTASDGVIAEAFMHFEIDRETDRAILDDLASDVRRVLDDVRPAVADWEEMRARSIATVDDLATARPSGARHRRRRDSGAPSLDGRRPLHLSRVPRVRADRGGRRGRTPRAPGSGLGILRDTGGEPVSQSFAKLPPEMRRRAREPVMLTISKANTRSTVHRPVFPEYIGVKQFDASGAVVGERRFLGLWTSAAYSTSPDEIPILRRKVETVLERAGFPRGSHSGKDLLAILEAYPRDELFQVDVEDLYETAMGILHLQERRRVRLFVRRDVFGRFFSCLVFVPRERLTTEVEHRVQAILLSAFDGSSVESTTRISESVLARLHVIVYVEPTATNGEVDVAEVELRLADIVRSWADDLSEELIEHNGEERAVELLRRYGDAFPAAYREDVDPRSAVGDIQRVETLIGPAGSDLALTVTRPVEAPRGSVRLKLFRVGEPMALSDVLPLLEHLGVRVIDERPYDVHPHDGPDVWIYDIGLSSDDLAELDGDTARSRFCDAFVRLWRGEAESDGFNRLVLKGGLSSRQVAMLRAYAKYMRQIGSTFGQSYIEDTLSRNPRIAAMLVELFESRFDPDRSDDAEEAQRRLADEISVALSDVASLDEDRILSTFLHLVQATTRTNWYQDREYASFKLDPARVPDLPLPRPLFEVWVYSPRCEGVHLRGGPIARGGIRWSDRREDFRTEVLGLMKAQMVKNAVIVPVGAKGGFVVKRPPEAPDRELLQAEVVACYQILIRGMLDVTDNIVGDTVAPPPRVVRYDGDDPYLVVAADKGTATFSDLANSIAAEYGFWLGDAFASGGSAGYDHKKMAITARGAWESVRRHFLHLGLDPDTDRFTVAGIGDMSGDVFGNGMLLSRSMQLVGAFDHRHVFLDPRPDPEASYAERKRLFELPRSSWDDYDRSLISEGGGVWPRSAKSVALSPEARALLCVEAETLTPSEVISALLKAPVDLLFNGGVGTYVKASAESHADVGDRANDQLRVDGVDLRCRAVVEGGNLGCTQRGRIEYALAGGLINTDAIDNSAGVDCSDHEVNIKVLLDGVVAAGDLTQKQRNVILADMEDEVARLVLRNNYEQNRAIANARAQAESMVDVHAALHPVTRARGPHRPHPRVPADRSSAVRASIGRCRSHLSRVRGASRVHEDHERPRGARVEPARRSFRR